MWPFSIVALALSGLAIATGCRRPSEGPALPAMNPFSVGLGILYLVHWFVVIPWVTLKMALLPKRLVWVKTLHLGQEPGEAVEEESTAEEEETGDLTTEVSQA
jgi:1,2-diacylglycerol 3-beta-glucosyltransferase